MKYFLPGLLLATLTIPLSLSATSAPALPDSLDEAACGIKLLYERKRDLTSWKPQISAYSQRHYGEATWELEPKAIVLHYTAGASFPWNLVSSKDFASETPGLAVQYVVEGSRVWQLLPPNVRSRGAFGINHRAINIEMVALNAADLAKRPETLKAAARLTHCLMQTFQIPDHKVYSHEQVSKMNPKLVPEVYDRLHPEPYHKIDPGEANMQKIRALIAEIRDEP